MTRPARWWAPGRVNLIGEHTDYQDGLALPLAIQAGCTVTVHVGGDGWQVRSAQRPGETVEVPIGGTGDAPGVAPWAAYVLGPAWLLTDRGVTVPPLSIDVDGDVPLGAGLASSAALVCAVTCAVLEAAGHTADPGELLALTRAVENDVVGAPTGGMDQLVSLRAREGHALLCDLRALTAEAVRLDLDAAGLALLVVDTGVTHDHAAGEYAARRRGCEEAARTLGVPALRDVGVDDLDAALGRLEAPLRPLVRHVVTENQRVLDVAELLRAGDVHGVAPLLIESHVSMRDDFAITVPEVDAAVDALLESGALGARMTGGGFGGCVIGLVEADDVARAATGVRQALSAAGFDAPDAFTVRPGPGAQALGSGGS